MASSFIIPTAAFETSNDTRIPNPKQDDTDISKQDDDDIPKQEPETAKEKSKLDQDLKMPSDAVDNKQVSEIKMFDFDIDHRFDCDKDKMHPTTYKNIYSDILYHTRRAIKKYNNEKKEEDASIKLVKIGKVNLQFAYPLVYCITFDAKDASGRIRTYQAMVTADYPRDKSVTDLVRLKPGCN